MTHGEFEINAGAKVSESDYEAANIVYMYHPLVNDKKVIGTFWKLGGRMLINDMLPRAREIQSAEQEVRDLNALLNAAKDKLMFIRSKV